jgi:hypothetical protein
VKRRFLYICEPALNRARLLLAVPALLGAGCATIQRLEAIETGRMLAAAGFHVVPADTAERQKDLRSEPPRRIVSRTKDGNVEYTYADPDTCHCVYIGGEKEYSEYERLRMQKETAQRAGESSPSGGARGGAP